MKANLKGGNAIARLALTHGEKVVLMMVLLLAAYLVYSGMGRERLDKEPERLLEAVNRVDRDIDEFRYEKLSKEEQKDEKIVAGEISMAGMANLAPKDYPLLPPLDPPVRDQMMLRTDPVLLAPVELEAHGDAGLWTSADPEMIKQRQLEAAREAEEERRKMEAEQERDREEGGRRGRGGENPRDFGGRRPGGRGERETDRNTKPRGAIVVSPRQGVPTLGFEQISAKSWVTVLAAVPIEEQYQDYEDVLEKARGYSPSRDIPNYWGYRVERAEVIDGVDGPWKQIDLVYDKGLLDEVSQYPVNPPDVIDPDVKHPILTHPLPPLILREWDSKVSHSSMPLLSEKRASGFGRDTEEDASGTESDTDEVDPFAAGAPGTRRPGERDRNYGRGFGGEMGGYGERSGYGGYGGEGGGYGGEMGGYGGEMGGYGGEMGGEMGGYRGSRGMGAATELSSFVWNHNASRILLRYFDDTVVPGHSYRYRFQLILTDVNQPSSSTTLGVPVQFLDKSVIERRDATEERLRPYRFTEWSEPSNVASVPLPASIYLAGAEPARETSYNDEPEAEIMIKVLDAPYRAEVARLEKFSRGSVLNIHDEAQVIWSASYRPEEEDGVKEPEFDFNSGITLVDMTGGEKLPDKSRAPARVVLMDAAGRLTIHSELDDSEEVVEFNEVIESGGDNSRGGYGGGMRGGYGGEEMGGYGGEGMGY